MAKSELQTKVAVLRSTLGLSAREFAKIVGRSLHTIKAWESGRLPLGEESARLIGLMTSAKIEWLLDADGPMSPPIDEAGKPLTKDRFEAHLRVVIIGRKAREQELASLEGSPKSMGFLLQLILERTAKQPNRELAISHVRKFLAEMEREFLPPKTWEEFKRLTPEWESLPQATMVLHRAIGPETLENLEKNLRQSKSKARGSSSTKNVKVIQLDKPCKQTDRKSCRIKPKSAGFSPKPRAND